MQGFLVTAISTLILAIFLPPEILGKPPKKIVGGTDVKIKDFPAMVSIQNWGQHFCGGALISRRHVLTAAHCICIPNENTKAIQLLDKEAFTIATGSSNAKVYNRVYKVADLDVHPQYTGQSPMVLHDIGIITMTEEAILDATVQIIALPTEYCYAGQRATVLGWGYLKDKGGATSEWLQQAPVDTITNANCLKILPYPIEKDQMCGSHDEGYGFCDGDSGGPLIIDKTIVGVVSMGYTCGSSLPDIYTRVYSYLPWIKWTIKRKNHRFY